MTCGTWECQIGMGMENAAWAFIFPQMTTEHILEEAARAWDMENWVLPVPRFTPRCVCGVRTNSHARSWSFTERHRDDVDTGRVKWRCNINLKCTHCGYVMTFGVAIPDGYAEERIEWNNGRPVFTWRQALEMAGNRGYDTINLEDTL